jgi:predicted Rossmann fold nucleotide-binding protein DprA/Smf involved in DNA uptake
MEVVDHIGNIELLKQQKTAFLCSRKIPASIVLKCYDWAISQRESGNCIVGGFHSKIEKDVLHYLLKGSQPIIIAMARGLKQHIETALKSELDKGRLLIISPFDVKIDRVTAKTAMIRNQLIIELADELVFGFVKNGGNLEKLINKTNKNIRYLS